MNIIWNEYARKFDFEKWQDIQEKWNDLKEKGKETEVARESNERDMKGRWEGKWDERKGKPEEHQKDMKEQKERREIK